MDYTRKEKFYSHCKTCISYAICRTNIVRYKQQFEKYGNTAYERNNAIENAVWVYIRECNILKSILFSVESPDDNYVLLYYEYLQTDRIDSIRFYNMVISND